MRILYFHQYFSTPDGSTGTRSYEMARRLVCRGHQVTLVCGSASIARTGLSGDFVNGSREGEVDGIHLIEFNLPYSNKDGFTKRSYTFLRYAVRSVKIALIGDYDLVFASSTPLTAGLPGIAARLLRRKPFVFEVRDLWPELPRAMGVITNPLVLLAMNWLEWLSYHVADRCVGLSPGIVQGIIRRGIEPSRIAMVPNGCDLDIFAAETQKSFRPEGVRDGDFVAIFSGTHGVANGLDAVLDLAAELRRRGRNDIKLLMVGDGKLKPTLMRRAEVEKLDNCLFLDPIPKRELANLQNGADAGLMILANVPAFYYGTSPNKFFDYIATGLPVLNNYPGWLADLITEHSCGVAVPPGDATAFADAIVYLADNREKAQVMGKNARRLAEKTFDREILGTYFVENLEMVYSRARGRGTDESKCVVNGGDDTKKQTPP